MKDEVDMPQDSWFAVHRTEQLQHMLKKDHNALILACGIAFRARWNDEWNEHGLKAGQAMIGDVKKFGLTEQKYRSAKVRLVKYGIATFEATSKGTIATLTGSTVSIKCSDHSNDLSNIRPTNGQRTANERPTTNIQDYTYTQYTPSPSPPANVVDDDGEEKPDYLSNDEWSLLQSIWRTGKLDPRRFPPESWKIILRSHPDFDATDNDKSGLLIASLHSVERRIGNPVMWFGTWIPKICTGKTEQQRKPYERLPDDTLL